MDAQILYDISLWFLFKYVATEVSVSQSVVEVTVKYKQGQPSICVSEILPSLLINTSSCEYELLPLSCVHRVFCIPESKHLTFGPSGQNKHACC